MSKQWTFTVAELDRILKYVDNLNKLTDGYGVALDSYSEQFVALVDEKNDRVNETVFQALYSEDTKQYVLAVVSV